jgi:excisionase family DNA binding protein
METIYYTPKEVAERLKLRVRTVYDYIRRGLLPAVRLGNRCRIAQSDLDAFLERQRDTRRAVITRDEPASGTTAGQIDAEAAEWERRRRLLRLIDEWLADESGYDEWAWPIAKQAIEDNRLSYRKRFSD